jgi:23S rRNA pseudouridine2605 synthase
MRINKYIAQRSGLSRRAVDEIIERGGILVNETRAKVGQQIEAGQKISYKDKHWVVESDSKAQTILYYKPILTLTSRTAEPGKDTIYDRLPPAYRNLKSAGRLDYQSEGLLILSENGDLIYTLTHPSNNVLKKYIVGVNKKLLPRDITLFNKGVTIDINGEDQELAPVHVSEVDEAQWGYLNLRGNIYWYIFELHEGRNNQIRRMCRSIGVRVPRLIRIQHGPYAMTPELHKQHIIVLDEM